MRFVLGIGLVYFIHWIYISSFVTLFASHGEHMAGGSSFYDFFRFSCSLCFFFLSPVSDASQWSIFVGPNKKKLRRSWTFSYKCVHFSLSLRFYLPKARRLLDVSYFTIIFFILAQSQLNWIRNRNLRTLRMYIEKVHIMLNAQRTTMMKTFSCSLFSLASRREWFVYVQHTNRLYLVWKSVTRFVGECLCVWTVNAPAVSFDDNDRDRRSLVECERGQTFRIKKIYRRQLDEHSVRDHIIFVSPVCLHFWNVYSDHSDWLRNRVWPTASAIYPRTLNRKNGAIDFVTAHDAMKYRITFGVDFITVRVCGRLCSFTVYDYLLLSSVLRWISRTRATNHRVTSSSVHSITRHWWRIFALHLQSIV